MSVTVGTPKTASVNGAWVERRGQRGLPRLMEQLDYNLLFRWFVGLGMDAPIWDATVFTKNRERLGGGRVCQQVHGRGARPAAGTGAVVERAFLG